MISPWCNSIGKRAFDLICSAVLLIATFPLMLLVALLVKISSPGPALYRHSRPGKNGREFHILKFRTMHHSNGDHGPVLTRKGDPRVTRAGEFLRKFKLDELPQLFNILAGQMSFVGPRPQPTKLWQHYKELPLVLSVSPGITGVATLAFRHEEELLRPLSSVEIEAVYIRELMPLKMEMDIEYLKTASFKRDLELILLTITCLFQKRPRTVEHERLAQVVTMKQRASRAA